MSVNDGLTINMPQLRRMPPSMPVAMVGVREVGVAMFHGAVLVPVGVFFCASRSGVPPFRMGMLVVGIVCVFQRLMAVGVLVPLRQVQPHAQGHQPACDDQWPGDGIPQQPSQQGAEERRH